MKMTFMVYNEYVDAQVTGMLKALNIDYYTRWEQVKGKGHGTEPHIGAGGYASTNTVLMIAFEDETPLAALIAAIRAANEKARRADERIRLFQMPMELMV
jgi:hypothetical protein